MARFRFNLRSLPVRSRFQGVVSQRTLAALNLAALGLARAEPVVEAPTQGPGWFDSSWELIRGLDVREDAASADLHLNAWLDACLRGGLAVDAARAGCAPDAFSGFELEGLELV